MKPEAIKLMGVAALTLLLSSLHATVAAQTNLLNDSGFDQQLPSHQGGWTLFDQSEFSSDQARSDGTSMLNWGFSRTIAFPPYLTGSVSGSFQEFDAEAGSRWQLTGYGNAPVPLKGQTAFGILQVSFFDADGKDLGTVETADAKTPVAKISNKVNRESPAGEWIFLDTGVATAPEGTVKVQAFTLYVDYSDSNISQGVYFDDLNLQRL